MLRTAWLLLALALGCQGEKAPASQGPKAKRVILIVCDTLRADRLGCYGHTRGTTPNLDAFAAKGCIYERAYAQSSMTMPSMAALLTGRPVDEIGVEGGNRYHLDESVTTLAEVAQQAGFVTGAVVSNFVLSKPRHESLETRGIAQGFDQFDDELTSKEANRNLFERVAPDTTETVLGWVDDTVARGRDDFFLLAHYIDPHGPYTPPEEFVDRFAQEHGEATQLRRGSRKSVPGEIPAYQLLGEELRAEVYMDRYDAEIAYADKWIGALLDGLRDRGLLEDALVIFTADHGETLGEDNSWFTHGYSLHQSNVHVPLIIQFPRGSQAPAGSTVATTVQHLDVSATILDAFGALPEDDPRQSLFRPLNSQGIAVHQLGLVGNYNRWIGIATDRWHLVGGKGREPELFDLARDPAGLKNVASEHAGVVADLWARYQKLIRAVAMPRVEGHTVARESKRVEESLKALGYGGEDDGQ